MIDAKDYIRDSKTNLLININERKLQEHKEKHKLLREIELLKRDVSYLKSVLIEKGLL